MKLCVLIKFDYIKIYFRGYLKLENKNSATINWYEKVFLGSSLGGYCAFICAGRVSDN